MKTRFAAAVLASMVLSGCASIVSGVYQPISVETRANGAVVAGASCRLSSNKGKWLVTTPASVTVHRGFQDLAVECSKAGFDPSLTNVASHVRPIAFGNILFGGIIGVAVDSGDGAAFDYPDLFTINLVAKDGAPVADAAAVVPTVVAVPVAPVAGANPAMADRGEHRYQIDAERFAVERSCASKPVTSMFVGRGPGFETYSVRCKSGDVLVARCDYGKCRSQD